MAAEHIRLLSLAQAIELYESMSLPIRPATLHPAYVHADAARDSRLQPVYLCFEQQGQRWMHALHLSEVPGTGLRDASSPYGYGGPVSSSDEAGFLAAAWSAYCQWMLQQRVVVEYVRFHPVLGNERHYGGTVSDNRMTVCLDLRAAELGSMYPPRLRQTLNKAQRAGLSYSEGALQPRAFGAFYREAMRGMGADAFYLFDDVYFEQLAASGLARQGVCRRSADLDSPWLAACLFLDGAAVREYHLAGGADEGREFGASAFALHQGACAAHRAGLDLLYLGGGSDTRPDNSLLFFKSGYSPCRLAYRTGATVFDPQGYEELKRRFPSDWAAHPERPIFYRKV